MDWVHVYLYAHDTYFHAILKQNRPQFVTFVESPRRVHSFGCWFDWLIFSARDSEFCESCVERQLMILVRELLVRGTAYLSCAHMKT